MELPALKQEFPEFKTVGSQDLQDVIERLDRAFANFFRKVREKNRKADFPRVKSRDRYDSFTLKQAGWKLDGRYLHISNVGRLTLFLSRPVEGEIKTVTVRRTAASKWLVVFSCDNVPTREFPGPVHEAGGIDVGATTFLADSYGNVVENPKYFRRVQKHLARRQRSLSRKKKGSKRLKKARILVAKAYEKVTDKRRDFCHKTALWYVIRYNMICVESLMILNMVRNRHLAKSIMDSAWGIFLAILSAK
ncbi:MAG TPA: transposase, partial [Syntrophales bacterium]|nr:transposase [Syntrophales bacterium]